MTDQDFAPAATAGDIEIPIAVLAEAVHAVLKTCDVQVGLKLDVVDQPIDPREAKLELGSNIALSSETDRWNLSVMADERSCQVFTRYFFDMGVDDGVAMEDVADAMGEIVNVAAGVFKAKRVEAGENIYIGLPLFMLGT
ncbi:MAG: chemotaxis protein CheX, partial [bacterium]